MWEDDLAPRRLMVAESMSEKAIQLLIIFIVELYEEECFAEIKEASLLYMMAAEGPQPPVVDRTMGINYNTTAIRPRPKCMGYVIWTLYQDTLASYKVP